MARDSKDLYVLASCRHRNEDFGEALLSVGPLPNVALFRLTKWFPTLQRLSASSHSRLVVRLDGHPPPVEYANDLVEHALARWRDHHGEWSLSEPASTGVLSREWDALMAPALPRLAERLKDNPL